MAALRNLAMIAQAQPFCFTHNSTYLSPSIKTRVLVANCIIMFQFVICQKVRREAWLEHFLILQGSVIGKGKGQAKGHQQKKVLCSYVVKEIIVELQPKYLAHEYRDKAHHAYRGIVLSRHLYHRDEQ